MAEEVWNALPLGPARGREQAFAELHDRLAAPMLGVARRITGSLAGAEDAVQQTFLDLDGHRHALAGRPGLDDHELRRSQLLQLTGAPLQCVAPALGSVQSRR